MPGTDLRSARALVTGAGNGIGAVTARALSRRGATVLCADLDGTAAKATAEACATSGGKAHAYQLDVADAAAVEEAATHIHEAHGPLDVLVNNAGVGMSARFLDATLEDWSWILGVNLLGVIHCTRTFGGEMVARRRGQVVNVASGLAYTPRATEPSYVTTKAAVLALSRCLRADWRRHGVGVSVVCPGVVNTDILRRSRLRGERDAPQVVAKAQRLFSRGHPPEAVAAAIVRAVETDRGFVPVGWEAHLAWMAHRLLPTRAGDVLAQATVGGV